MAGSIWIRRAFLAALIVAALAAARPAGAAERRYMVAAANPHAALAGIEMLAEGGSAVDAAVAIQAVLGLVEPQSSGLGGGAFLLTYDAGPKRVRAYDGRETAPAAVGGDLFAPDGEPMKFLDAMLSGRSVGAPGVVAMLWKAHRAQGRLAWARLFDPAIRLARAGFRVSPRLAGMIAKDPFLKRRPGPGNYFFAGRGMGLAPLAVGDVLRNPSYAAALQRIAAEGPKGFYEGPIAKSIVAAVRGADVPGALSLDDLAAYEAKEREPVCRPYRAHLVCGMPPPTSGGITTLQILGILEALGEAPPAGSPEAVHLLAEASRLAFADRNLYLADPDFVAQPVGGLLDPDYLAERAKLIDPARSMGRAEAGSPTRRKGELAPGSDRALPGTSHFAVLDAAGNAVSMTTSVEAPFGAHLMVEGFLLNNQLTDFSFRAERDGRPVANRVAAGKRPRSSMSPTLILDRDRNFVAALGSPGGSRIIGYVAQAVVGIVDRRLAMQEAFDAPHAVNRNGATEIEAGTALEALAPALEAMGHEVRAAEMTSGLHGILVREGRLEGGADKRREGVVLSGLAGR